MDPREDQEPPLKVPSNRVGVRELRQNLSVYLRRVKAGEALEVMERGHVVAVLTPVPAASSIVDRLVAAGRAVRALGDPRDIARPKGRPTTRLSEALAWVRQDRI